VNSGCIGTCDAAGNMTEGPAPDALTSTHKYVYDAWNRLAKVTDASDNTIEAYEYDALGRRIVKRTAYSGGSPQDTYDYYYNTGYQVLEERLDGDTDPVAQYVWHPYYIDAPVLRWFDANMGEEKGTSRMLAGMRATPKAARSAM